MRLDTILGFQHLRSSAPVAFLASCIEYLSSGTDTPHAGKIDEVGKSLLHGQSVGIYRGVVEIVEEVVAKYVCFFHIKPRVKYKKCGDGRFLPSKIMFLHQRPQVS